MKISIITPFYEGGKYLDNYFKCVGKAIDKFKEQGDENSVQIVLINDSPWMEIEPDKELSDGMDIKIIRNNKNSGIHKSRVNGIREAHGEYILMLDQDDEITEMSLTKLCETALENEDADVVLGNGFMEMKKGPKAIFENKFSQDFATRSWVYSWIRDFITSPGQCLIKKDSIPEYWMKHTMRTNGTDDYLLWLLMFNGNCKFVSCDEKVYIHKYTGANYSLDDDKMFDSTRELLKLLKKNENFDRKTLKLIKRRIYYKKADRTNKSLFIKESIKNIDIFLVNVFYRLVWRGCLIEKE